MFNNGFNNYIFKDAKLTPFFQFILLTIHKVPTLIILDLTTLLALW